LTSSELVSFARKILLHGVSEVPDNRKLSGRFLGLARSFCWKEHVDEEQWSVSDRAKPSYALDSKKDQSHTAENRNV